MAKKRITGVGAMLRGQCPRCRQGKIFVSAQAYRWDKITAMPDACPECGEDFLREPGFYFGAAYVSYALTVALWVSVFVALTCLNWWGLMAFSFFEDVGLFLTTGIVVLIFLLPMIARLSRSMWLHMMTRRHRK